MQKGSQCLKENLERSILPYSESLENNRSKMQRNIGSLKTFAQYSVPLLLPGVCWHVKRFKWTSDLGNDHSTCLIAVFMYSELSIPECELLCFTGLCLLCPWYSSSVPQSCWRQSQRTRKGGWQKESNYRWRPGLQAHKRLFFDFVPQQKDNFNFPQISIPKNRNEKKRIVSPSGSIMWFKLYIKLAE